MPRAMFNGTVIAQSDQTVVVEGNHYFPAEGVNHAYLRPNDNHTMCPWKGVASYYDVVAGDEVAIDGAWYYPTPSVAAARILHHIAFWRGVEVVTDPASPPPGD